MEHSELLWEIDSREMRAVSSTGIVLQRRAAMVYLAGCSVVVGAGCDGCGERTHSTHPERRHHQLVHMCQEPLEACCDIRTIEVGKCLSTSASSRALSDRLDKASPPRQC